MVRYFISSSNKISAHELRLRKRNQVILANLRRCKKILADIKAARRALIDYQFQKCA